MQLSAFLGVISGNEATHGAKSDVMFCVTEVPLNHSDRMKSCMKAGEK